MLRESQGEGRRLGPKLRQRLAGDGCLCRLAQRPDSRLPTSHLLLSPERGRAERSAETPCHQLPHLPLTLVQPTYMLYPWIAVSQRC